MGNKFIDDSLNLGLGIFYTSKDAIGDLVDDLIKRGEVEREDKADLINEYNKKAKDQLDRFNSLVDERIKKFIIDKLDEDKIRDIVNEEIDKRKKRGDIN